jgi:NAD(P)H-flavin reductase
MLPRPGRVIGRRVETRDTVTLELEPTDGAGIDFMPGQFMMLYVLGVGEVPVSAAGSTRPGETIAHTVRAVGAVTAALCELDVGGGLGLRGPYGTGWPVELARGRDVVVAAGGIGLAPLRPVIHYLFDNRDDFGAVSLIYGARAPAELMYERELHEWRSRFDFDSEITVDRGEEGWYGDVGVVTILLPRITFDPANVIAMVCGPEVMMRATARELGVRGVADSDIYLSLERNMKCAIGFCGRCQFGPDFLCRDGPVVPYQRVAGRMQVGEL